MSVSESPELVDFDAAGALEAGREVAGEELLTCIEYTHRDFHTIYVSDRIGELYDDREHMSDHFSEILAYCFIDFSERQLFEQKLQAAGRVQFFLTRMEHAFIIRIFTDAQGLFFTLTPDAPVQETLNEMRSVMLDTDAAEQNPYST